MITSHNNVFSIKNRMRIVVLSSSIGMNVLYQDLTQKEMEKSYYLTKEMETSMALLSRSNEMV